MKLHNSNQVTFWKRQNQGDRKKTGGFQRFGAGGRMDRQGSEGFHGSENTLQDNIMMNVRQYSFVQTHKMSTPRVKPSVDYRLWVTIMWEHNFILCN